MSNKPNFYYESLLIDLEDMFLQKEIIQGKVERLNVLLEEMRRTGKGVISHDFKLKAEAKEEGDDDS